MAIVIVETDRPLLLFANHYFTFAFTGPVLGQTGLKFVHIEFNFKFGF